MGPEGGVHHPVLQIAIAGPDRAVEPGGDKYAQGCNPVGMYVKETENLRFRISQGMDYGAGFQG